MELSRRRPGPDVVRAVALIGVVVMNYHGYLIIRGASRGDGLVHDLFDPWTGPLSTRFAATFVLVAGVGVTLMTRSSIGDPARTRTLRLRLAKRGGVLYLFGVLFDDIWNGTILPYYGAMFFLAAAMFTLRGRWLIVIGAAATLAGWGIRWWLYERAVDGHDTTWLTSPSRSLRGLAFDVFVNGTHPLLPWLAFFCAGIVLGRLLDARFDAGLLGPIGWRPLVIGSGLAMFTVGTLVRSTATGARARVLLSTNPYDRGLMYAMSALGTALIAFAVIGWMANHYAGVPLVDWLRRAGQMSLTLYIAHALVFNLVVDWLGWVRPTGLDTALLFSAGFWIVGIAAAVAWQHQFERGPAEAVYRRITV